MWSPPPQKTQGLEGGKPRWVDSFLISEVCPILSETFLGCWKLSLLDFYGSLPEVNDWQGHLSSLLTLGFRCCRSTSLAHRRCQLRICVVPTRASRRWGLWTMLKQSVENQNHQRALWMEHAWLEKKETRKFRSLRIVFFAGFWAFCWCLLLPSWFIWFLCITTDSPMKNCHASSKSCHTYVETSNQRPNHKRRIYQPAGRWGWIASIRVPWLQIVIEDWSFFFLCKVVE